MFVYLEDESFVEKRVVGAGTDFGLLRNPLVRQKEEFEETVARTVVVAAIVQLLHLYMYLRSCKDL